MDITAGFGPAVSGSSPDGCASSPRSLTDKTSVSGAENPGSIPGEGASLLFLKCYVARG